jgi:hypothetical protein
MWHRIRTNVSPLQTQYEQGRIKMMEEPAEQLCGALTYKGR